MKKQFSNIDTFYMVNNMQIYVQGRINNIYEYNSKNIILKLDTRPQKSFIILSSGYKFHTIQQKPDDCPKMPGSFGIKLRKHLKNKRISKIRQLGFDRIVVFTFGEGETSYHLILEMYSHGNIILLDHNFKILHLLRRYTDTQDIKILVNQIYPMEKFDHMDFLTTLQDTSIDPTGNTLKKGSLHRWFHQHLSSIGKPKKTSIKQYLMYRDSPISSIGPTILAHCIKIAGYNPNQKIKGDVEKFSVTMFQNITNSIVKFFQDLQQLDNNCAYLIIKQDKYVDFIPYLFEQYQNVYFKKYPNFNTAVMTYFAKELEHQKLENTQKQSQSKLDKVTRVKNDIYSRINKLEQNITADKQTAEWLTTYSEFIDLLRIQVMQQSKYIKNSTLLLENIKTSWNPEILKLNSEISLTHLSSISLHHKTVTFHNVEIHYLDTAYSNARRLYTNIKKYTAKLKKTKIEGFKALERVETKNLQQKKSKKTFPIISKKYWFQKFNWFITTDNLICVAGKNASQNEVLVKKHLTHKNLYIHGDFYGSPSSVLCNPNNLYSEIPISSQLQAGCFIVCMTSHCWKRGSAEKSYTVAANQVSKHAPSGEYVSTGSFMIRGKKNYLPKAKLEIGLALLFVTKDETVEETTNIISQLHSNPSNNDNIVYCIPMVGPYNSVNTYKYKAKLKPGKKTGNKVAKSILASFLKQQNSNERERFLIKNINPDQLNSVLISNVELAMSYKKK